MNLRLSPQGRLVGYTATAHGLIHTVELTYAALLLRIGADFDVDKAILGVLANAFAFMFGASALPSGFLVDRLGSKRVISFALIGGAATAALVGISPNTWVLGVFLGLLGLSIGLYHPAGLSLIAQGAERRGIALGYHGVAGNLGLAIAPGLAIGLAELIDWRAAYFFLAALCVVMAVLLQLAHIPEGDAPALPPETETGQARPPGLRAGLRLSSTLLPLVIVYVIFVINGFIYRGFLTFMPAHIEENVHVDLFGIDEAFLAGSLTTLALLAGVVGQYIGGNLAQRHALERLAPLVTLALVPALLVMGVAGGLLLVAAAATFVFFNFTGQPVYTSLIAEYSPAGAIGRSYGVSFFAGFGLGSAGASVAGVLAEAWGTASVFLALSAFAAVTLALASWIWRLSQRVGAAAAQPLSAGGDGG